ncbi:MAG TPA: Pvc16 family protein [Ignavibacteriaceae bacterium]|nr:Pvc16 family protein [Ignavibacteriaceae bacterium]
MIYKALEIIKNSLAEYLGRLPGLNITGGDSIILSHLVRPDGTLAVRDNTLAVTLVNIEENNFLKVSNQNNGSEVSLNLSVLISANYQNYGMALKYISAVVDYFRERNVFTKELLPDMDPSIKKIAIEFSPINFVQQNHLWTSLGAKYIPSALYTIKIN